MHFDITTLLQLPISLFGTLILAIFFSSFLGKKYKSKALYVAIYTAYFIANSTVSIFKPELVSALTVGVCFAYPIAFYGGRVSQRIICGGLLTAYAFVSEILTMIIMSYISGYTVSDIRLDDVAYYVGACSSVVLLLSFVFMVTRRRKSKLISLPNNYYFALLLIAWLCAGLSFWDMTKLEQSGSPASVIYLLSEVAIATLSVLVFFIFESYQIHAEHKERNTLLERQLLQEERRFMLIDEKQREVAAIRHDMVNHLTSLNKLLSDGQYDEAKDYLGEYSTQTSSKLSSVTTGKPSIDALISEKIALAERSGIKFTVEAGKLSGVNVSPYHLNIILSNALDNAIEACNNLPESENRYISLGMKTENYNLCIRVINPALPPEFSDDGLPITSKEDKGHHGLGLSAIKRVAESYNGTILCTYADGVFTLYVQIINKPLGSGSGD